MSDPNHFGARTDRGFFGGGDPGEGGEGPDEPFLVELDEDATLALKLLAAAAPEAVLMLPVGLDSALRELEDRGFAAIIEPAAGIPLASITPEGREQWGKRA